MLKTTTMKKFTLLLCAIIIAGVSTINGQVIKGKISVGATSYALGLPITSNAGLMSLGFGTSTHNNGFGETKYKVTGFNMQPKVGYMITGQFSAGLELLTSVSSSKEEDASGKDIESLFTIGRLSDITSPSVRTIFLLRVSSDLVHTNTNGQERKAMMKNTILLLSGLGQVYLFR